MLGGDREQKIDIFLDTLSEYFNSKKGIEVDYKLMRLVELNDQIKNLNENIKNADKSSSNLAKALNRLTFWGVIAAGLGVTIAILNFAFQYFIK